MYNALNIKKNPQNIFIALLKELRVKHTNEFSEEFYFTHPHKNSLYGLSSMLSEYNIDNEGIRLKNKNLSLLDVPFIAHINNDFILVTEIHKEEIECFWKDKKIKIPTDSFMNIWSGIILLIEPTEHSSEPKYRQNRRNGFISAGKKVLLFIIIFLLSGLCLLSAKEYPSAGILTSLLLNLFGGYISYLLLRKQMHLNSNNADYVCSLFNGQKDCNDLLETDASRLWGILSWSEIGLGYFIANLLIICFFPFLYPYATLVTIFTLPFTVWSIYYQKFQAKVWCPLCVIVQVVLWLVCFNNAWFGFIALPEFPLNFLLIVGCLYASPILILNLFASSISQNSKTNQMIKELKSIKSNEQVFKSLLKTKNHYEVNKSDSNILLGNKDSNKLITIVSNPHCNPCAKLHQEIDNLMNNLQDDYCIQYIFTPFDKEESCKLIIAMYQKMSTSDFTFFLNQWFTRGKHHSEQFNQKYPFNKNDTTLLAEYEKHQRWIEKTGIMATPTLLLNGFELPNIYKLEDFTILADMDVV